MRILSVDPGDVHVGMALWDEDELVRAWETDPVNSISDFRSCEPLNILVIESYQLYPWASAHQTFSKMPTSQLIGRMKQVAEDDGIRVIEQTAASLKVIRKTPYYRALKTEYGRFPRHADSAVGHGLFYLHMSPKGPLLA